MGGRSPIPDRPKNVRIGRKLDSSPPGFRESPTRPAMPVVTKDGLSGRQKPLHDTIPEMRAAKLLTIKRGLESEDSTERWRACTHLNTMIEATAGEKDLRELVRIALGAFEGEKDPNVIFTLLDCFAQATNKGDYLNTVLGGVVKCLDSEQNAELRKSVIALLEAESYMDRGRSHLVVPLLKLLSASTEQDEQFLAEIKSQFLFEANCVVRSQGCRYMLKPTTTSTDYVTKINPASPRTVKDLKSGSAVLRTRAMNKLISYVIDADSAREVLSLITLHVTKEAEEIRTHCIEKIKKEI
ncbi:hypothetical protein KKE92_03200 [Candidatus Micrarchaeota archaeon]|nr:hypothetical protein [Candidatus Micrarchaeota archaeon]MBU1681638.1 hypothetical protein [Candidatus Micrarchaeota archaeon]